MLQVVEPLFVPSSSETEDMAGLVDPRFPAGLAEPRLVTEGCWPSITRVSARNGSPVLGSRTECFFFLYRYKGADLGGPRGKKKKDEKKQFWEANRKCLLFQFSPIFEGHIKYILCCKEIKNRQS